MAKHLIAVLGTSLYEPVVYGKSDAFTKSEQEFVQISVMNEFKESLEADGKITIFLTQEAKKRNWDDRIYNNYDVKITERWKSKKKEIIICGNTKRGFNTILKEEYPYFYKNVRTVDILQGSSEDEIWDVFEKIYDSIEEEDEIIFDVTHGFRSIPMLVMTLIPYLKVMKNCSLCGIYYGAFEASKEIDEKKVVPLFDLTSYSQILDWTNAADSFMKFGDAAAMNKVYLDRMKRIPDYEKIEWKDVRKYISSMECLADCISTCRGMDGVYTTEKTSDPKKSIKNAYKKMKEFETGTIQEKAMEMKPLYPLLKKASKRYEIFDQDEDWKVGREVVRWSIENNMIQQGYTALEETLKTYLCTKYQMESSLQENRDDIMGTIVNSFSSSNIGKSKYLSEEICAERKSEDEKLRSMYTNYPKQNELFEEIIHTIPTSIIQLCTKVKNKRNDINHFGFRPQPANASSLKKDLKTYFDEFESIVEEEI